MTASEAAVLREISTRRAQILYDRGKVKGAVKMGITWIIPRGTPKPIEGRTREAKKDKTRLPKE